MSDGIDLASVTIHNSHDVRSWPATATITRLEFRQTGVHVEHTKRDGPGAWPNFRPPGWDGDLQYTLWIFLNISGAWHGMGGIQFWQSCEENGGPPEAFAQSWYYAADRWAPMTGHQPTPGELVGFMVSAGDARNSGEHSVDERSQVILMPFPVSGGFWVNVEAPEPPVIPVPPVAGPEPLTPPPAPPVPVPSPYRLVGLLEQIAVLLQDQSHALERLEATAATKDDLAALRQEIVEASKTILATLTSSSGPAPNTALTALTRLLGRRS